MSFFKKLQTLILDDVHEADNQRFKKINIMTSTYTDKALIPLIKFQLLVDKQFQDCVCHILQVSRHLSQKIGAKIKCIQNSKAVA